MTVNELIEILDDIILEDEDNGQLLVEVAYWCCDRPFPVNPVHIIDEYEVIHDEVNGVVAISMGKEDDIVPPSH